MRYKGDLRALVKRFKNGVKNTYKDGNFKIIRSDNSKSSDFQLWVNSYGCPIIIAKNNILTLIVENIAVYELEYFRKCLYIIHEEYPEMEIKINEVLYADGIRSI